MFAKCNKVFKRVQYLVWCVCSRSIFALYWMVWISSWLKMHWMLNCRHVRSQFANVWLFPTAVARFFLFTLFSFKFSHRMCTLPQPMMLLLSLLTATMCHKVGKYCYKCFRWLCGRVWLCVCIQWYARLCVNELPRKPRITNAALSYT